ncbi:NifB/NifX family molybdenum-iron cluster-binding protein [Methylophaga sp.]|uniref:dinitrogenase iron-molybdenum cofactor N-terminal domain-containing protein n=1 Tax=Methylophaga sp. TaxID=2024840 RepID=UPI00271CBB12|nr:NifB/NifX family molybdenum-iron cluster-binding protein [Methylophaga sp.]MDO8828108.1 dinitrogenase iron-molybdenum cofactor N-terminal domain-containing protein [Methylophaga sp.]
MSQSTLSRELALGIGLAARALPNTDPKQLVTRLTKALGLPLTAPKLHALTVSEYQSLLEQTASEQYSQAILSNSLDYLHSIHVADEQHSHLPTIKAYQDGDIPYSIRLAIASDNGININGQFSTCEQFYIYQLSSQEQRLIDIRKVDVDPTLKAEQKQQYRAELIQDCQVLYGIAIGGQAAAKVVKQGIHPMKISGQAEIADIIAQLQQVLVTSPPPWLAKIMGLTPKKVLLKTEKVTV